MIIDSHLHISTGTTTRRYLPWRQSWSVAMGWAYNGGPPYDRDPEALLPRHEIRISDPDASRSIETMDEAGVDTAVVLPIDYDFAFGEESDITPEEKHQQIGEMQRKYPGRILGLAGVDPRRLNGFEIFKRGIEEHKLNGLKLIPACGYYPWEPRLFQFYQYCTERGLPVFMCTQAAPGGYRYIRFSEPFHVGDMISEFPDMTVVMLHAGHPFYHWFEESILVAQGTPNIYVQFDFWVYGWITRPYVGATAWQNVKTDEESVVKMISRAKACLGAHKILFGSDSFCGPAYTGKDSVWHFGMKNLVDWWRSLPEIGKKYGCDFTDEEVDLMLGGNAARILGIEKPPNSEIKHKYGWMGKYPSPNAG